MSVSANVIFGAVIGLSLSIWPGEGLSRTVRGVVRGGVRGGLAAGAGCVAANLLAALTIGVVLLATPVSEYLDSPLATIAEFLAGAVLVVLGWRLMEDRTAGALHRDRAGDHVRSWSASPFADRLLTPLVTPRWHVLWWFAGAGILLGPAANGWSGWAAFAVGLAGAGLLVRIFVAVRLSAPGREWALSDRLFRIVTTLTGLAVVGMGFLIGLGTTQRFALDEELCRIVERVFG